MSKLQDRLRRTESMLSVMTANPNNSSDGRDTISDSALACREAADALDRYERAEPNEEQVEAAKVAEQYGEEASDHTITAEGRGSYKRAAKHITTAIRALKEKPL